MGELLIDDEPLEGSRVKDAQKSALQMQEELEAAKRKMEADAKAEAAKKAPVAPDGKTPNLFEPRPNTGFERYQERELNIAGVLGTDKGNMRRQSDNRRGVFLDGRYKGKTPGQVMEETRKDFAAGRTDGPAATSGLEYVRQGSPEYRSPEAVAARQRAFTDEANMRDVRTPEEKVAEAEYQKRQSDLALGRNGAAPAAPASPGSQAPSPSPAPVKGWEREVTGWEKPKAPVAQPIIPAQSNPTFNTFVNPPREGILPKPAPAPMWQGPETKETADRKNAIRMAEKNSAMNQSALDRANSTDEKLKNRQSSLIAKRKMTEQNVNVSRSGW